MFLGFLSSFRPQSRSTQGYQQLPAAWTSDKTREARCDGKTSERSAVMPPAPVTQALNGFIINTHGSEKGELPIEHRNQGNVQDRTDGNDSFVSEA